MGFASPPRLATAIRYRAEIGGLRRWNERDCAFCSGLWKLWKHPKTARRIEHPLPSNSLAVQVIIEFRDIRLYLNSATGLKFAVQRSRTFSWPCSNFGVWEFHQITWLVSLGLLGAY